MGFDDESWFCDADLDILITRGKQDRLSAEAQHLEVERNIQEKEMKSEAVDQNLRKNLASRKATLDTINSDLSRYEAERAKRKAALSQVSNET